MLKGIPRIIKLILPTPYPVGDSNAYFIDGPKPTLVDTGLFWLEAMDAVAEQLNAHGKKIEDIQQILITHDHHDHAGAALQYSNFADAPIYVHKKSTVGKGRPSDSRDRIFAYMQRCGLPEDILEILQKTYRVKELAAPIETRHRGIEALEGNEIIEGNDFPLKALPTPGHCPDHMCYFNEETGILFSGDMLLPHITPNPLLYFDPENENQRIHSLENYIHSLHFLKSTSSQTGYPGHGDNIDDVPALIKQNLHFIDKRKTEFKNAMSENPQTPYDLALTVFGKLDPLNMLLAVYESVAYLDLFLNDQDVKIERTPERIRIRKKLIR